MKINQNFLGGGGVQNKKIFRGGRVNIFWNCTLVDNLHCCVTCHKISVISPGPIQPRKGFWVGF